MVGGDHCRAGGGGRDVAELGWQGREIHADAAYTGTEESTVESSGSIGPDEFQALEQKVLRAVEVVRCEREARAAAEAEVAALRKQLDELTSASNGAQNQITMLNQERETVRLRVEKMLQQMDELL